MSENSTTIIPSSLRPVGAAAFREAMSRVAASVHLVTTDGAAGRAGMTATAVTSVTDNPATILVCINSSSRSCQLLQANGVFGVSVLTPQDQKLASVFAGLGALP